MSTETLLIVTLQELRATMERIERRLDQAPAGAPGRPDRLSTADACAYAGITDTTLYRWRDRGLLRKGTGPRPWSRDEIDHVLDGVSQRSQAIARSRRRPAAPNAVRLQEAR